MTELDRDFDNLALWLTAVSNGNSAILPKDSLERILIACGADVTVVSSPDVQSSLLKGTNEGLSHAMNRIWGAKFKLYKQEVDDYIVRYKANGGTFPKSKDQSLEASSARKLFGFLTSIVFGLGVTSNELTPYIYAMVQNGVMWKRNKTPKDRRIKLPIWNKRNDKKHYVVPMLPVGYIDYFISVLKKWANA